MLNRMKCAHVKNRSQLMDPVKRRIYLIEMATEILFTNSICVNAALQPFELNISILKP